MNYSKSIRFSYKMPFHFVLVVLTFTVLTLIFLSGCKKSEKPNTAQPTQVTVLKVEPKDTPVVFEFVGQTKSSHQVEIRARVNGFLDKRVYIEGSVVKAGDVMFKMDPKPFQAQLDAAQASLAQQQARLKTAQANLARVIPLAKQNALSQKDLDDSTGQEQAAAAAVEAAKADVEQAKLNLGYCTITSPVTGLSSYARVQDGAYVNQQNSLLTYVAKTDPIWVNFSISENDILKYRRLESKGLIRTPKNDAYTVEIVLADGFPYPIKGMISFADAEYNQQTGTFLLRSTFPNPKDKLRPGQFVTVRLWGIVRPNAISVPQRAVLQGAKGHFVWVVGKDNKVEARPVVIGDWIGNDVFVEEGLRKEDLVAVDGTLTLSPGIIVVTKPYVPSAESTPATDTTPPKEVSKKPADFKGSAKAR